MLWAAKYFKTKFPLFNFRELGGVNSPLEAKQNCPSPNASEAQSTPKSFERVNVYISLLSANLHCYCPSKHIFFPTFLVFDSHTVKN